MIAFFCRGIVVFGFILLGVALAIAAFTALTVKATGDQGEGCVGLSFLTLVLTAAGLCFYYNAFICG